MNCRLFLGEKVLRPRQGLDWRAEGHRFKSCIVHHRPLNPKGFGGFSFVRQRWKRLFLHMGIRTSSGLHPLQWVGRTGPSPLSSTNGMWRKGFEPPCENGTLSFCEVLSVYGVAKKCKPVCVKKKCLPVGRGFGGPTSFELHEKTICMMIYDSIFFQIISPHNDSNVVRGSFISLFDSIYQFTSCSWCIRQ